MNLNPISLDMHSILRRIDKVVKGSVKCNSKFELSAFSQSELSAGFIKPIMFDLVLGNHFLGGFDE